jgi:recombination associated protein RdgC
MDLVDIIAEKKFVGQEFLTWLWWKSEERGGSISLEDQGDISVVFEKHMLLEYGEGQENEKVICRGLQTELKEARTGISIGKKLEQARIRLEQNELEWSFTLAAGLMEFRNVRLPKTAGNDEFADDRQKETEGLTLERIFLFEELIRIVNCLFKVFLDIRVSSHWQEEILKIRGWIENSVTEI